MTVTLLPQELLSHKRDGEVLCDAEIQALVQGINDGGLCDAQIGAFAMALRFRGMQPADLYAVRDVTATVDSIPLITQQRPAPAGRNACRPTRTARFETPSRSVASRPAYA